MDTEHVATLLDAVEFRLEWLADYGVREYGVRAESVRLKYVQAADALRRDALHDARELVSRDDLAFVAESLDFLAGVDEGEHTDYDRLVRLAAALKAAAGLTPQPATLPDGGEWREETLHDGTRVRSYWLPGASDPYLVEEVQPEPRTILVHVNIEVPAASTVTANDLGDDVQAAIMAHRTTGALAHAEEVSVPLAEEV